MKLACHMIRQDQYPESWQHQDVMWSIIANAKKLAVWWCHTLALSDHMTSPHTASLPYWLWAEDLYSKAGFPVFKVSAVTMRSRGKTMTSQNTFCYNCNEYIFLTLTPVLPGPRCCKRRIGFRIPLGNILALFLFIPYRNPRPERWGTSEG